MKVAVLPLRLATFLTMYLNHCSWSAMSTSGEAHVDLGLAAGGDFVVLALDADADFLHLHDHLVAEIVLGVGGGNREVAALVARLVAQVGELFAAGVPGPLGGVDRVEGRVRGGVVTDVI